MQTTLAFLQPLPSGLRSSLATKSSTSYYNPTGICCGQNSKNKRNNRKTKQTPPSSDKVNSTPNSSSPSSSSSPIRNKSAVAKSEEVSKYKLDLEEFRKKEIKFRKSKEEEKYQEGDVLKFLKRATWVGIGVLVALEVFINTPVFKTLVEKIKN